MFIFRLSLCKSMKNKDHQLRDVWSQSAQGLQVLDFLSLHYRLHLGPTHTL